MGCVIKNIIRIVALGFIVAGSPFLFACIGSAIIVTVLNVGLPMSCYAQPQEIGNGELLRLDTIWGMKLGREIDPVCVSRGDMPGVEWIKKNIYRYAVKNDADPIRKQMNDCYEPDEHRKDF